MVLIEEFRTKVNKVTKKQINTHLPVSLMRNKLSLSRAKLT